MDPSCRFGMHICTYTLTRKQRLSLRNKQDREKRVDESTEARYSMSHVHVQCILCCLDLLQLTEMYIKG